MFAWHCHVLRLTSTVPGVQHFFRQSLQSQVRNPAATGFALGSDETVPLLLRTKPAVGPCKAALSVRELGGATR